MAHLEVRYFSQVLGLSSTMTVILPQASGEKPAPSQARYPVLYLLHGLSDDHTIWVRRTSLERYVEGRELVVVMPAAHRSFYTDMACGYRYQTHLVEELPTLVSAWFPLSSAREDTFVAGLSMGGYGAFKFALSYPHRYGAAASLSGALDMARLAAEGERQVEMQAVFGDPTRVAGSAHDLFHLVERAVRQGVDVPPLYQWCGTEDFLYGDNLRFRDLARRYALPLTYEEGSGAHEWGVWDRQIRRVLDWLPVRKPVGSC